MFSTFRLSSSKINTALSGLLTPVCPHSCQPPARCRLCGTVLWCSTLVRGAHHCSACWVLLQKMYGNNPFFSVLNWGLLSWQSSPCCVDEGCLGTARTEARTELSHPRNVLISIHPQNSINNNFLLQHQLCFFQNHEGLSLLCLGKTRLWAGLSG